MGTAVPSGRVVVAGPANKLTCCAWPKPITAAKRRNTLTTPAAFSVALDLKSLIRIIVLASRSVVDTKPEFFFSRRRLGVPGAVAKGRAHGPPRSQALV